LDEPLRPRCEPSGCRSDAGATVGSGSDASQCTAQQQRLPQRPRFTGIRVANHRVANHTVLPITPCCQSHRVANHTVLPITPCCQSLAFVEAQWHTGKSAIYSPLVGYGSAAARSSRRGDGSRRMDRCIPVRRGAQQTVRQGQHWLIKHERERPWKARMALAGESGCWRCR